MSVFVDTSALYSLLDADDEHHPSARETWARLVREEERLITSNYILVETVALLQHRLGLEAVRDFQDSIVPPLRLLWVGAEIHQEAVGALMTAGRRRLSLVDCSSFALMRWQGLSMAFGFDNHFVEQGFALVP